MFSNVVAVLALVLSGLSLYLQWRTGRAALRVSVALGPQSLPVRQDDYGAFVSESVPALAIGMTNRTNQPVHVHKVTLDLRGGEAVELAPFNRAYKVARLVPFTVEPLRTETLVLDADVLKQLLGSLGMRGAMKGRVVVQDEAGRSHKSRSLTFDVD